VETSTALGRRKVFYILGPFTQQSVQANILTIVHLSSQPMCMISSSTMLPACALPERQFHHPPIQKACSELSSRRVGGVVGGGVVGGGGGGLLYWTLCSCV
jgi:hypothetical protein